ncbi:hypothetical protein P12x_001003 [Tundrisphaera lichenicola]|uniref:hypothetical protein n=1 Tax=Tundrisphaera lichenicola TaxID=2029860 RepID=UPI003EB8195E
MADSGPGSLRQAILDNNATPAINSISFNIPGSGIRSIAPTSPLPEISNPVILDATSQPDYAGSPLIELNGANIFQPGVSPPVPIADVNGLVLGGGSSVVKGLLIDRFTGSGIRTTRDGNTITANYIGTDATGSFSLGNGADGIALYSRNNVIGGSDASSRNLISGNSRYGVLIASVSNQPANNSIQGNYLGTDVTGTRDIGNALAGVFSDASGNSIGGGSVASGNIIAYNGGAGVQVGTSSYDPANQNRISHNSIFGNAGLGIDLGGDGVSFNQPGANFGPNNHAPFPNLTSVYQSGSSTTVEGSILTIPNTTITVEFFSNLQAGASGYGQGRTFLASQSFLTDNNGLADITTDLPGLLPVGQLISASATDSQGNTSEFARSIGVVAAAQADLSVTAQEQNPFVQATVPFSYTFNITNNGPSLATNVIAVDTLPEGADFLAGSSSQGTLTPSNGKVTFNVGSLPSGSTAQFTLTYSLPVAGPALNTVTVMTADQADPTPQNNTITQNFRVSPAPAVDLSLYGSSFPYQVQVGDNLTYSFVVSNNDPNNSGTGVTLTDVLPQGVSFVSAQSSQGFATFKDGVVTANIGTLNPFFNAVVTIVVQPSSPGNLTNSATVSGNEPDSNAINNQTTVISYILPAPATDLAVLVTAAPQPANVGQGFTYAILVGNAGSATATNVILTNLLPDNASVQSIKASQGTFTKNGDTIAANLGTLAPGAFVQLTIVLVPGAPGSLVDQAAVTSDQPDYNVANNYSMLATPVAADVQAPTVLNQQLVAGRNGISRIVLTFDKALNLSLAELKANYQILDLGQDGSKSGKGPKVAIATVTYDAVTRSVTLIPKKPLSIGRFYKLVVNGPGAPGLVDKSGNVLDGVGNGLQNSIYTSLFSRGTKNRPNDVQYRTATPQPPTMKASAIGSNAHAVKAKASSTPVLVSTPVPVSSKKK